MTLTVRNSLLAISALATALILWLITSFWYDAYLQRTDAARILQNTSIEDDLIGAAHAWATERLLVQAALNATAAASEESRTRIRKLRDGSDALIALAFENLRLSLADRRSRTRFAQDVDHLRVLAEVESQVENLHTLRQTIDAQISMPSTDRDPETVNAWLPTITDVIVATQRIRVSTRYQPQKALHSIAALRELKHAVWTMSEFAGREQAIIAGTIAADDPLILDDVEKLSMYRGHLEAAWFVVDAYAAEGSTDARVAAGASSVRDGYFERFQLIRSQIIEAGMEGARYPMTVEQWIIESNKALGPILNLGVVAGEISQHITSEIEAHGVRRLVIDTAVFVLTLVLAVLSVWVVVVRIVRPLDQVTRAMTAIAGGEQNVEVPVAEQNDEIGTMIRAINTFKDSAERHNNEISAANAELVRSQEELRESRDKLATKADELAELTTELQAAKLSIEKNLATVTRDIELASNMQQAILPTKFADHISYDVGAFVKPLRIVGGDFYEFFQLDGNRIGFAIADVAGKGIPAAFFMAISHTMLETVVLSMDKPSDVLDYVNQRLCLRNPLYLFVTLFYGILDLRSGTLTYSNGGHNPPFLIRTDNSVAALPLTDNTMLGVLDDVGFNDRTIDITPGDTLFLYTDGITESFTAEREMYGDARLAAWLKENQKLNVEALLDAVLFDVSRFVGDAEQSDDLTGLCIRFNAFHEPAIAAIGD